MPDEEADALYDRVLESFLPSYLTIVSIMQGAVLGVLITVISDRWNKPDSLGPPQLHDWLIIVASFILIVAVWNEYRMGATLFVWAPRLLDALIPFGLGGCQLFIINVMKSEKDWFFVIGGFFLFGALAYWHMYWRASGEPRRNRLALRIVKRRRAFNIGTCLVLAFMFLIFGGVAARSPDIKVSDWFAFFSVIGLVWFLLRGELEWSVVLRSIRRR